MHKSPHRVGEQSQQVGTRTDRLRNREWLALVQGLRRSLPEEMSLEHALICSLSVHPRQICMQKREEEAT